MFLVKPIKHSKLKGFFHGICRQLLLSTTSQPAFTCSKLTIETLEQGVKYVQS